MSDELAPLLSEPFARAWAAPAPPPALRRRLGERLAQSLQAEAGMVTVRRRSSAAEDLGGGVQARWLYRADLGTPLRPGEPYSARVLALLGGSRLALPASTGPLELLVLAGAVEVDGQPLAVRDFLRLPAGSAPLLHSPDGAEVFLREAEGSETGPHLVRDQEAGWPEFAPGIRRRVLWAGGGQAALLYHADAGASVPVHTHGHDEECLMVAGELFLDDVLLQAGDYQIAPAGSGHRITATDTGVILYAHGDLDLNFV